MPEKVCDRCGGPIFYTRRYSGESFCAPCFKDSIVEKTRRTISRYGMMGHSDRVGVAVSGGKDSLALLQILHKLNEKRGGEMVALTVDEGVAGYREEAIDHAATLCASLGVRQVTVSYRELFGVTLDNALDWKDEREVSSCSICGVFRRRAIDEAAAEAGVNIVATAHNLDDCAQTFMMNLLNGDVDRISLLDPASTDESFPFRRVKPFMEIYEEEIALYSHLSSIPFQSVSCPYMHEGLRSEIRDYLNELEARHPGMKNVLLSSSLQVSSRLTSAKPEAVPCRLCGSPSSSGLCSVCRIKQLVEEHTKYTTKRPSQLGGGEGREVSRLP